MSKVILTLEKNVSCLPGYESFDTKSISKRMPKKFRLKSIKELQFEKDKRQGILRITG